MVSSSSWLFVDDVTSFSIVVDVSSVFDDDGVSGILNDLVFVVELGVTVVLDPRRLPLRKIRSVDSCDDGIEVNWWSRLGFCFVERTSDLYLEQKKNSKKKIQNYPEDKHTEVEPNFVQLYLVMHRRKSCLKHNI